MRTTKRTDTGTAPYVHLAGGYLELDGPAVLPGSAMRFYRGKPPAVAGVPLHTSKETQWNPPNRSPMPTSPSSTN